MAADLVVVNHHLFFADMALRDSGVAELLPTVRRRGVRRGAPAGRSGRAVPRHQLGTGQVIDFARDLLPAGLQQARGLRDWQHAGRQLEQRGARTAAGLRRAACASMRGAAQAALGRARRRSRLGCGAAGRWPRRLSAAARRRWLTVSADRRRTSTSSSSARWRFRRWRSASCAPAAEGQVRWIDLAPQQARLVESPLDIRNMLQRAAPGRAARPGSSLRRRSATTNA